MLLYLEFVIPSNKSATLKFTFKNYYIILQIIIEIVVNIKLLGLNWANMFENKVNC